MSNTIRNLLPSCVILALGIALSGFFIGNTLYKSRIGLNTATVKGLAERRVDADQANWRISYSVTGKKKEEIPQLYQQAERNRDKILEHIKKGGFKDHEIAVGIISYSSREYRDDDENLVDEKHTLSGMIEIQTDRVAEIEPLRSSINKLMVEGIDIMNYSPQYRFTGLNKIKPDMLQEATKNARIAAAEFATNAGAKVGKLRSASYGNFTITDVGESRGDTKSLKKDVRVVTTAEFYIDN